jgi:2,4-dienoyl-CoA reductase (NADPH2)
MSGKARFEKLFEPLQIKQVKFRNRIVKPSQVLGFADKEGYVGQRNLELYEALAKGGVGMIIAEDSCIDFPVGGSGSNRMSVDDDKFIPSLSELTKVIHKYGCPTFLQIGHVGPSHHTRFSGLQPVAASSLSYDQLPIGDIRRGYDVARELTVPEIQDIVEKFAKATERAQKAGFDGVEVHACHSYILNSFLSRAWNKRHDAYGCQSLESRARFAVEVLQAIKERVGQDFPVGIRINGGEWTGGGAGEEEGITSEESQVFGRMLQEAGADYLHITGFGYGYGPYGWMQYPEQLLYPEPAVPLAEKVKKPGALVTRAEAIKKVVSIPVIGVGALNPKLGEWLLEKGKVDLIALGRPLLADPELPNKIASGRLGDIAPCIFCLRCRDKFGRNEPAACTVNAALGREREYAIKPAEKKKRVMVVGGGPAGMEVARVAALRGHEVALYERESKLGGLLPMVALVKGLEIEDLAALVLYLRTQITKLGVKVRCGKEVTLSLIEKIKPDVIILATGGIPSVLEIPGINRRNVVGISELHRKAKAPLRFLGPRFLRLLTRFWMPLGKRVVIMGGSIHGCELAEFLVKRKRKVTIVEQSNELGTGMSVTHRDRLVRWLAENGVTMLTEVKYEEVIDRGLTIVSKEGKRQTIEADTICLAIQLRPNTELFKTLEDKVPEAYMIGDCREPHLILDAIAEGSRIGRAI